MEVTGNGVAHLAGMDKECADMAVLDSNDAKLVDGEPVILEGGKIGKPGGWLPPDLTPFVPACGKLSQLLKVPLAIPSLVGECYDPD